MICIPESVYTTVDINGVVCEVPTMGPLHAILNCCSTWGPRSSTRGRKSAAMQSTPFPLILYAPPSGQILKPIRGSPPEIFDGCACRHCREWVLAKNLPRYADRHRARHPHRQPYDHRRVELQKTRADWRHTLVRRQTGCTEREILYRLVTNLFLASLHKLNRCRVVVGTVEMSNQLRSRAIPGRPIRRAGTELPQTLNWFREERAQVKSAVTGL